MADKVEKKAGKTADKAEKKAEKATVEPKVPYHLTLWSLSFMLANELH